MTEGHQRAALAARRRSAVLSGDFATGWAGCAWRTLGDDDGCGAARCDGQAIVGCDKMQAIKDALRHSAAVTPRRRSTCSACSGARRCN